MADRDAPIYDRLARIPERAVADAAALPTWAALVLYLAAGIVWLWLFPMRRILFWMEHGRWRP